MTLLQATIAAIVIYALLQFALLPAARASARRAGTPAAALGRLSLLAGLSFLRDAALTAIPALDGCGQVR